VPLADSKDEAFLFPRRDSDTYNAFVGLCRHAGFEPYVAAETADVLVALRQAEAGLGVALVARSATTMCQLGAQVLDLLPPVRIDVQMVSSTTRWCLPNRTGIHGTRAPLSQHIASAY